MPDFPCLLTIDSNYAQIIDEANESTTYQCWAEPGTASSEAKWKIRRITKSGNVTTIKWANGDALFDNIADNRASLEYS